MNDIEALKKKFIDPAFSDDKQRILEWESDLKRAQLRDDLANHDAMKEIIKELNKNIEEMNQVLTESDELDPFERSIIMWRKKLYFWFLNLFKVSKATVREIEKEIKEELK